MVCLLLRGNTWAQLWKKGFWRDLLTPPSSSHRLPPTHITHFVRPKTSLIYSNPTGIAMCCFSLMKKISSLDTSLLTYHLENIRIPGLGSLHRRERTRILPWAHDLSIAENDAAGSLKAFHHPANPSSKACYLWRKCWHCLQACKGCFKHTQQKKIEQTQALNTLSQFPHFGKGDLLERYLLCWRCTLQIRDKRIPALTQLSY